MSTLCANRADSRRTGSSKAESQTLTLPLRVSPQQPIVSGAGSAHEGVVIEGGFSVDLLHVTRIRICP